MTHKLTRQERKEALEGYDRSIKACENHYDKTGNKEWQRLTNELQRDRAARLAELEGSAK